MEKKKEQRHEAGYKAENQKLKTYLILQILQQQTDENHLKDADAIRDELAQYGIEAERRSIYRDIDAINQALWLLEERRWDDTITIEDAVNAIKNDKDDEEKTIVYVKKSKEEKGYYCKKRRFTFQEIRLIAESIYSAKFLSEAEADALADVLRDYVSEYQANTIKRNAYVADRIRTNNADILFSLSKIDEAIAKKLNGEKHEPEKITFKYMSYALSNLKEAPRRQGNRYKVSPYQVIVNDGNYYLLAFDDNKKEIRTFRVDRMKQVSLTGETRDGAEAYTAIDLKNFTRERFGMFDGRRAFVSIRCINPLLDAMVERFGTQNSATYTKTDEDHFTVSTWVRVSDQFFGWLLGFGRRVKLVGDDKTVKEFAAYLKKVKEMY